jgi:hypothetical protein
MIDLIELKSAVSEYLRGLITHKDLEGIYEDYRNG